MPSAVAIAAAAPHSSPITFSFTASLQLIFDLPPVPRAKAHTTASLVLFVSSSGLQTHLHNVIRSLPHRLSVSLPCRLLSFFVTAQYAALVIVRGRLSLLQGFVAALAVRVHTITPSTNIALDICFVCLHRLRNRSLHVLRKSSSVRILAYNSVLASDRLIFSTCAF